MKFSAMKRPPIKVEYCPHDVPPGEGLKMSINLDLLTLEKMEELDSEFVNTMKTAQAEQEGGGESFSPFVFDKANVKFKARSLGGNPGEDDPEKRLIRDWEMTDDDENPIPVSYEFLEKMAKPILDGLYNFITAEASKPTKKSEPQ